MIRFEWDEVKNKANHKKHGIWFEEAQQVFDDPEGLLFRDVAHSQDEDHFILLGRSASRILVVIHCERDDARVLRIISARKATKKEIRRYEKGI
jgi:uncharacterized DUF497 family protein